MGAEINIGEVVARKRHKEILDALSSIVKSNGKKDDSELKELLQKHSVVLGELFQKLQEVSKPVLKSPDVVVNNRNEEVVKSINDIADKIVSSNNELKKTIESYVAESKREKDFEFVVKRNNWSNFIEKITGKIR